MVVKYGQGRVFVASGSKRLFEKTSQGLDLGLGQSTARLTPSLLLVKLSPHLVIYLHFDLINLVFVFGCLESAFLGKFFNKSSSPDLASASTVISA